MHLLVHCSRLAGYQYQNLFAGGGGGGGALALYCKSLDFWHGQCVVMDNVHPVYVVKYGPDKPV